MAGLFDHELLDQAAEVLRRAKRVDARIVTVETVTGGLVAAALTSVSGASSVFERGFIFYHGSAKASGLGIPEDIGRQYGVVSAQVTEAFASAALDVSPTATATVALTGYAGPTGGNERDGVGTVYTSAQRRGVECITERHVFDGDRFQVKLQAVDVALRLLSDQLGCM